MSRNKCLARFPCTTDAPNTKPVEAVISSTTLLGVAYPPRLSSCSGKARSSETVKKQVRKWRREEIRRERRGEAWRVVVQVWEERERVIDSSWRSWEKILFREGCRGVGGGWRMFSGLSFAHEFETWSKANEVFEGLSEESSGGGDLDFGVDFGEGLGGDEFGNCNPRATKLLRETCTERAKRKKYKC